MQRRRLFIRTFVLLALSFSRLCPLRGQENSGPSSSQTATASTYPNTPEGLQRLLLDMLVAAKNGETEKLAAFARDMEIPNCVEWHRKMFDAEKADRAIESCDSKILNLREKSMAEQFLRLAKREGDIAIRKVNDHPQSAYSRDWLWLQAIKSPLDIYDASWEAQGRPEKFKSESIGNGYFLFIEGGFRWESDAQFTTPKMNMATFVPPKLIKQVQPVYPPAAGAQHIGRTVRLEFVVGADGAVYNPHPLAGKGLSDDPSLIKAAKDAVLQWRYQPATIESKPIQTAGILATLTFAPQN
jgi:Gram-negative bacterial TonB protein C-terminal